MSAQLLYRQQIDIYNVAGCVFVCYHVWWWYIGVNTVQCWKIGDVKGLGGMDLFNDIPLITIHYSTVIRHCLECKITAAC